MRLEIATLAALLLATPALAAERAVEGRLRVGGTGVMCVREPCPRIGVMAVAGERDGQRLRRPLFAGGEPPKLTGSEADKAAVRAAWLADGCLVLEGRFAPPDGLVIRRVVGPCGPKD